MRHPLRRVAAIGLGSLMLLQHAGPAAGQPEVEVGEVEVVDADGDRLSGGGSTTPFSLELPDGAECPGDSTDDDYRVNSYMVPSSVDPLDVTYNGLGPTPSVVGPGREFRQPLYDVESTFFVSIQTEDAEDPGDPGKIQALPLFDFDVFKPGDVPPGPYNIGIACTLFNEIERVWNAQIEVTVDQADEPAAIRWSVVGFEPSDGSTFPIVPVAGVVVALATLVFVLRRRRLAAR